MIRSWGGARPAAVLLLLFFQVVVLDAGTLSAAVAVAATATAAAGSTFVACAVIASRRAPVVPPTRVRTAIRDRERRTAFLSQRDPDARGRTRPRAPGDALLTVTA